MQFPTSIASPASLFPSSLPCPLLLHSKARQPSTTLSRSTPHRCGHNLHFDGDSIGSVSSQLFLSLLTRRSGLSFLLWAFFSASAAPFTSLPAASSAAVAPTDHTRPQPTTKSTFQIPSNFPQLTRPLALLFPRRLTRHSTRKSNSNNQTQRVDPFFIFLILNHGRFLDQRPARRRRGRGDC